MPGLCFDGRAMDGRIKSGHDEREHVTAVADVAFQKVAS
ncbi:MAG: hypothetical protein OJF62_000304 [Pseudolabrys sp.]|nr:hypothetical protein [Pseudolabrys sp.]